jgi:hypothetical protein
MRFLSFSNKKKQTSEKRFEPGASSVRPGPPAPAGARNASKFAFFFSRKFGRLGGGDMGSRSHHYDFFCSKSRPKSGDLSL